jgi:hypothetical protein
MALTVASWATALVVTVLLASSWGITEGKGVLYIALAPRHVGATTSVSVRSVVRASLTPTSHAFFELGFLLAVGAFLRAGATITGSKQLSSATSVTWVLNSTHLACTVTHTSTQW